MLSCETCKGYGSSSEDKCVLVNDFLCVFFWGGGGGGGVAKNLHFMIFVACKKLGSCKIAISDDTIELFSYFQQ